MNLIERLEPAGAVGFDYSTIPANDAEEARAAAARIHERNRAAVIDTGRDLLAIKDRLGHGHFGRWLEAEFRMNERTAQRYMNVAAELGDKSDIVSVLPPTALYQLTAPSTPAPVREEVVKRIEAGERLDPAAVDRMVHAAKQEARQDRMIAKLNLMERRAAEKRRSRTRSAREQREAAAQRTRERHAAEEIHRERATTEVAELIKSRMGDDLPRFLSLMKRTYWGPVERALTASEVENGA